MTKNLSLHLKDMPSNWGISLILLSLYVYVMTLVSHSSETMGSFFICYLFSVGYTIGLFIYNFAVHRWKFGRGKLQHTVLLLILWFISAFSLNLELHVFESSTPWLCMGLVISCISLILATHYSALLLPYFRSIVFFFLGFALILFVYYSIFLLPLFPISLIGILALGISLHTYIPLLLTIVAVVIIIRAQRQFRKLWIPVALGMSFPVLVGALFLTVWYQTDREIDRISNQHTLASSKLPKWVLVGQQIEPGFVTERLLKSGLIYYTVDRDHILWNNFNDGSMEEPLQHDPLVVLATFFFKRPNLDDMEKIKILKSMYHIRKQPVERLWSGDRLSTTNIISDVRLFPTYRMAYTEQTFTIQNSSRFSWNTQEAIYTFKLAEGSVVSSLSLWIDGKEEKSRLTTKSKADSAYNTIVGVEQRDPSVVHWHEGNTVSLRVFPVPTTASRKFKIGVTSPLSKSNNRLTYQAIQFDGPSATDALHSIRVRYDGQLSGIQVPSIFNDEDAHTLVAEGRLDNDWTMSFNAPKLSSTTFAFGGESYQLRDYQQKDSFFDASTIYLDVNARWTPEEFDTICKNIPHKKLLVYDDGLKVLTPENRDHLFERLQGQQFSVFPIFLIKDPERSLLVTKSSSGEPALSDLKESEFSLQLAAYLSSPKRINTFHIGDMSSPYLKALKELRVLHAEEGRTKDLIEHLKAKTFPRYDENEQQVVIEDAQLAITKSATVQTVQAPDHLLRLFAYNDIMRKVGAGYFSNQYIRPDLIAIAETAYIVSPVSSLIVLESQKDYDRFDIQKNKNSLDNASMNSSGAVPEPHEWALIALCLLVVGFLTLKNKRLAKTIC